MRCHCGNKAKASSRLCQKHYNAELRQRVAKGEYTSGRVPPEPTLVHIDNLQRAGLSIRCIAREAGMTEYGLRQLRNRDMILAMTSKKILDIPIPDNPHLVPTNSYMVPAVGSMRRVRALVAMGHTLERISQRSNHRVTVINRVCGGKFANIRVPLARDIDRVFREMQLELPPDNTASLRAKLRAERRNWPPPLAWNEDEIDDPSAHPHFPKGGRDDWYDTYAKLINLGVHPKQIAKRMGIKPDSLTTKLRRRAKAA